MMKTLFLLASSLLGLVATVSAVDADKHEGCPDWANHGECESNPSFMLIQCAKSCHGAKKEAAQILEQLAGIDSFFQLSANDITGKPFDFSALAGQVTVLTNVASYCGYTESHYHGLVELYSAVADAPVTILAFPCNQFGQQEPGSAADIQEFAASKGVKFQLMEKINVNGPDAHLVYKYLKYHTGTTAVTWNFATYFVVSPDGTTVQAYHGTEPMELLPTVLELAGSSSEL